MPSVRDLKLRLASVCSFVDRIDHHLMGSEERTRELEELERLLLKAAELTGTLIGGRGQPPVESARPQSLDLHDYLLEQERRLQGTFGLKIQLTFQWLATDALVQASAPDVDDILSSLVEAAVAARPFGGALTVSSDWLDVVGNDDASGVALQEYVRVTVAENHEPHDAGLSLIASVVPIVRRLRGFVMLDRTPDERRRIHVCLPIVSTPPGDAA